ncbi:MAG: Gfo/Idh/MocA family oxidoreductase [Kiritimatiellae bacterium]|nr:Gfo/Idh/MocA family oxidoreductase [Kiritimatiellia bacterium]
MNICIIGLGSIGQRHIRNIHAVARARGIEASTDVVEPRELDYLDPETRALVGRRFASPSEIGSYDMAFVTNPSQLHRETLEAVKDRARFFFVEKPVFTEALPADALGPFADERRFYVACPIRHTRVYRFLSEFVPRNKVFCARAICSSYLPDWRPGTDYRRTYAAQEGAGGVKLDLIHEFDYLFTLFGLPQESRLIDGKFSDLELRSVDGVSFVARYPDKTLELHLDYYGRVPRREIELYTADDVVVCDFIRAEIRFLKEGRRVDLAEERNEYCLREIGYFFDFALDGAANVNSIPYANSIVRFVLGG